MPLAHRLYMDNLPPEVIKDIPVNKHRFVIPSLVFVGKSRCELRYPSASEAHIALAEFSQRWQCGENPNAPQLAVAHGKYAYRIPNEFRLWRVFFDGITFCHTAPDSFTDAKDFDALVDLRDKYANPSVLEPSSFFPGCSKGYVDFNTEEYACEFLDRFRFIFGYGKPPPLVKVVLQKGTGRGDTAYTMYG